MQGRNDPTLSEQAKTAPPPSTLFPSRLYQLLEDAEREGNESIVAWTSNGESFKVHDKIRFANDIMPRYFGSSKYRSFQKNLNLWGFITKLAPLKSPHRGEVSSPSFVRGFPEKCLQMKRVVKNKVVKKEEEEEEKAAAVAESDYQNLNPMLIEPSSDVGAASSNARQKKSSSSSQKKNSASSSASQLLPSSGQGNPPAMMDLNPTPIAESGQFPISSGLTALLNGSSSNSTTNNFLATSLLQLNQSNQNSTNPMTGSNTDNKGTLLGQLGSLQQGQQSISHQPNIAASHDNNGNGFITSLLSQFGGQTPSSVSRQPSSMGKNDINSALLNQLLRGGGNQHQPQVQQANNYHPASSQSSLFASGSTGPASGSATGTTQTVQQQSSSAIIAALLRQSNQSHMRQQTQTSESTAASATLLGQLRQQGQQQQQQQQQTMIQDFLASNRSTNGGTSSTAGLVTQSRNIGDNTALFNDLVGQQQLDLARLKGLQKKQQQLQEALSSSHRASLPASSSPDNQDAIASTLLSSLPTNKSNGDKNSLPDTSEGTRSKWDVGDTNASGSTSPSSISGEMLRLNRLIQEVTQTSSASGNSVQIQGNTLATSPYSNDLTSIHAPRIVQEESIFSSSPTADRSSINTSISRSLPSRVEGDETQQHGTLRRASLNSLLTSEIYQV